MMHPIPTPTPLLLISWKVARLCAYTIDTLHMNRCQDRVMALEVQTHHNVPRRHRNPFPRRVAKRSRRYGLQDPTTVIGNSSGSKG